MNSEQMQTLCQILILAGVLITSFATYGAYHFGQKVQKEKEFLLEQKEKLKADKELNVGTLIPEARVILSSKSKIYPEMQFGDTGAILAHSGQGTAPLFKFTEDNRLEIKLDNNNAIKVSTIIRNKDGKIIAEIIDNEWKVSKNNAWDRNYNSNSLEVRDESGDIVLQIRLIGNRVQLQGKFYDSTGQGVAIGKVLGPEGWGGGIEVTGKNKSTLSMKIQPLFLYPSDSHLGELVKK